MRGQAKQLPQAIPTPLEPYRRQIVGLPLQRSLFSLAAKAATTIGFPGLESELTFPAWLDENGDLFLDRSRVAALSKTLLSWFGPETLEVMHTRHAAACETLVGATDKAGRIAASLDQPSARQLTEDLANKIALVMAYGILSKFVPDVLLQAQADAGDVAPPPYPEKSAGSELMRESFGLYQACGALDYSPQRLQQEWPRVSPDAFRLLGDFCNRQRGFGPLAWDSPGYEDPNYVARMLHSAFDGVDAEQVRKRLSFVKGRVVTHSVDLPKKVTALRRVLGFWLDFLERETWYVRRAFYVGMIPLLRRLAAVHRVKDSRFQPTNLLFLDISELLGGIADLTLVETREHRYLDNAEYLSLHGVNDRRLATMLGDS